MRVCLSVRERERERERESERERERGWVLSSGSGIWLKGNRLGLDWFRVQVERSRLGSVRLV